jgi:hypothetical protein
VRIRSTPLCEHRPTAGPQSSKLMMRVRFPLFALTGLRGSTEEQPTSNRFDAGSSPAGGASSRFSDEERGLQNRARGFDSLSALQRSIASFRRGGIHARVYETRCPGSTPGGRTTSLSSRRPRTPASHVGNAGSTPARDTGARTGERRRLSRGRATPLGLRPRLAATNPARDATCPCPAGCRRSPPKRDGRGSTPRRGTKKNDAV